MLRTINDFRLVSRLVHVYGVLNALRCFQYSVDSFYLHKAWRTPNDRVKVKI